MYIIYITISMNNNNDNHIVSISFVPEHEYQKILKENIDLRATILQLSKSEETLKEVIKTRDLTIDELKKENNELKERIATMENKLNFLIKEKEIFEALSKLNDCDKLANDNFKKEYRKYFNLKKYDNNIPNLGQFVLSPPDENDDIDEFKFWKYFCNKYPNSDNIEFQKIYKKISNDRIQHGAHYNINKNDFDKLLQLVMPDIYNNNKKLCDEYKEWIYLFN